MQRLLVQFKSPLIYILLLALALDLGLWVHEGTRGMPVEALAIALILMLNAGLGAYQESKADSALARLRDLARPFVWVIRDGRLVRLPGQELVQGDVVRVEAGDRVPADGMLVDEQGVSVDESVLTGESLPIDKESGAEVLSGTLVVRGKGLVKVTRTGPASAMGRLARLIGEIEASKTPLERRLGQFGNQIAVLLLGLGLLLTIGGIVVEGIGRLGQVALFSVALAVAAVPEGLPAVLTLTLAMGVERLARRKAVVRRLKAVEALGSVTVIATDKTGTLTENRMHVRAIEAPDEARALKAMVLANDAELATTVGDPLELALLDYASHRGSDPSEILASRPRLSTRPFDSGSRFMRVTVDEQGRSISYLKGAPEVIIARCAMREAERERWRGKALGYASEGYRVIALACSEEEREQDLELLGLVMLWDPPRPEVAEALRRARDAGIRVVMITGDHPATAQAVAKSVGLDGAHVITGDELVAVPKERLAILVAETHVFARVAPEHKLRIVEALKSNGDIVAVTGDGVNDAPALRRADVGVAMGLRGSDVAREVADIVLLDDNFATIVAAIEEGRSIYENIQKFIRFFFSTDLALIMLMTSGLALAFLLGIKDPSGGTFLLPLTAVQLLWINVVADGPPALALALDRNPDVMSRPPRSTGSRLLDNPSLRFIAISASAKAVGGLGLLVAMPRVGYDLEQARTALFVYESMMQLVFAYPCRHVGLRPAANTWVHVAVWGGLALQLLTVLLAPLRVMLDLVPLEASTLVVVSALALLTWGLAELVVGQSGLRSTRPAAAVS